MRRTAIAFTLTLAGTAAATGLAQAQAPPALTITPAKPCYLSTERVTASGGGFTAGGPVAVKLDQSALGTLAADPAGAFTATVTLGRLRGVKPHTLTATDGTNPALIASATFMGTTHRVTVRPRRARAGVRLRLRGSGFLAGPRVYMHVRGHGVRTDKRVGRAAGPCGTFSARTRVVPANADSGNYRVQFDSVRRFSKRTTPKLVGTMTVTRRIRSSAASIASARAGVLTQTWSGLD